MHGYQHEDLPADELARQEDLYGPFTQSVRELVDATLRTTVDEEEVRRAQAEIEAVTARLRASTMEGSYGVRYSSDGTTRPWGNAVVGLRNPVAPPLAFDRHPEGRATSDFTLGAAYEGPPGLVHGGVSALILDQALGEACGAGGRPGMTGGLTLTYRRPTRMGRLRCEAWIADRDGYKTVARGTIGDADGATVEAEGIFIVPKWARGLFDARNTDRPDRFE
ncbi:PaaI family thioesterase [Nocardioides solisilvae]|uniref:PaaI family thioesterase n=1 Tax=Nocardioides solisilvae TaxID=1542435 RepID=UPI000D744FA3|nr:PaaI family thioesterase [Nocardioides solisilvae]